MIDWCSLQRDDVSSAAAALAPAHVDKTFETRVMIDWCSLQRDDVSSAAAALAPAHVDKTRARQAVAARCITNSKTTAFRGTQGKARQGTQSSQRRHPAQ